MPRGKAETMVGSACDLDRQHAMGQARQVAVHRVGVHRVAVHRVAAHRTPARSN